MGKSAKLSRFGFAGYEKQKKLERNAAKGGGGGGGSRLSGGSKRAGGKSVIGKTVVAPKSSKKGAGHTGSKKTS